MAFNAEIRIQALHENLDILTGFVANACQRLRIKGRLVSELETVIEETACGAIEKAYRRLSHGELLLRIEANNNVVDFYLTHWGDPEAKIIPIRRRPDSSVDYPGDMRVLHAASGAGEPTVLHYSTTYSPVDETDLKQAGLNELKAMLAIGRQVATTCDIDQVLDFIIKTVVEIIGADRGTLYLVDNDRGELYSKVLQEETGQLKEIRVKIGDGIAGGAAETGETLNVKEAYTDPRFVDDFDLKSGYKTKSILAVPMINLHREIIGVIQVLNKKTGYFSYRDERLLRAMAAQAAIRIENKRLHDQELLKKILDNEIETTRAIQTNLLPVDIPQAPGWDISGLCRYCDQTGGDYFDVFSTDTSGRNLAVVIGDVSGHGLSSALLMAMAHALIRMRAAMPGNPAEIMDDVNRQICKDMHESGQFMTLFYSEINLDSREISWVRAGHDPALMYDPAADSFEELKGPGPALGLAEDVKYSGKRKKLESGCILFFGTDGIWEFHNKNRRMFGKKRLRQVIRENAGKSAAQITDQIIQSLYRFCNSEKLEDDASMVIIKAL